MAGLHNHNKEFGKLNSVIDYLNNAGKLVISPATKDLSLADTKLNWTDGFKEYVAIRFEKSSTDHTILDFAQFNLTMSVGDTISNAGTVPSILATDATHVTLKDGIGIIEVTFPKGTYVANETVTVTIANFTAPDGRTVTGGTAVFTIKA
jgi:hypothetical protein